MTLVAVQTARTVRRSLEPLGFWSLSLAGHLAVFGMIHGLSGMAPDRLTNPPELAAAVPVELIVLPYIRPEPPTVFSDTPALPFAAPAPQDAAVPQPIAQPVTPFAVPAPPQRASLPQMRDPTPSVDHAAAAPPPDPPPQPERRTTKHTEQARPVPATPPRVVTAVKKAKPPAPSQATSQAAPQTPSKAATPGAGGTSKTLLASWGKGIMAALARQSVRGRDIPRGTVTLALTIDTGGRLLAARVARSSGHSALDQAALAAVGRARFPAAPKGLPSGQHGFTLPVASR